MTSSPAHSIFAWLLMVQALAVFPLVACTADSRPNCDGSACTDGARDGDATTGVWMDVPGDVPLADASCTAPCINDQHCVSGQCVAWAGRASDPRCSRPEQPFFVNPRTLCHWPGVGTAIAEGPSEFQTYRDSLATIVGGAFIPGASETDLPPTWLVFTTTVQSSIWLAGLSGGALPDGVLRVLDPQTCRLVDTLEEVRVPWAAIPAIGDLDGDGFPEIVALAWDPAHNGSASGRLTAWKYMRSDPAPRFRVWRQSTVSGAPESDLTYFSSLRPHASPTLADLDDDGVPEVLMNGRVYDHELRRLAGPMPPAPVSVAVPGGGNWLFQIDLVVDLDGDHRAELVYGNGVFTWNATTRAWDRYVAFTPTAPLPPGNAAVADMGVFPESPEPGRPELVVSGVDNVLRVLATTGAVIRSYSIPGDGVHMGDIGAPSIANLDDDPQPEILVGSDPGLTAIDLGCDVTNRDGGSPPPGCSPALGNGVRWAYRKAHSAIDFEGATTFDFDGDGRLEVVYEDECWLHAFDGATGRAIYSHWRPSYTASEVPIVLAINGGADTVIAAGSNAPYMCTDEVDPNFAGLPCHDDRDCFGAAGSCHLGICRCTRDAECCAPGTACAAIGFACRPATDGGMNACRAIRIADTSTFSYSHFLEDGIDVLGDANGRWASSRPLWNQDAYSVTNVNDDGTIPRTSAVVRNWSTPGLNNYRSNVAGTVSTLSSPDLTAREVHFECSGATLAAVTVTVCNRGARAASAGQVARFRAGAMVVCDAFTTRPLGGGACESVRCTPSPALPLGTPVIATVNPDARTFECGDATNNASASAVAACP